MSALHTVAGQEALDLAREYDVKFHWCSGEVAQVYRIIEVDSFGKPMLQVNFVDTGIGNQGRLWFEWGRHIELEIVS